MPNIKSDLTNKSYSNPNFRTLEVSDESQQEELPEIPDHVLQHLQQRGQKVSANFNPPATEEEFLALKKSKAGGGRLSEAAKKRIEVLCNMSRLTKEVDIDGNIFILKSLKSKEMREAIAAASKFDGSVELPFETRKQLLIRSISHVAGHELSTFLGDSSVEAKLEFIEELDHEVLVKLYNEYLTLSKEITERYYIKTESDAQEVVDNLKK